MTAITISILPLLAALISLPAHADVYDKPLATKKVRLKANPKAPGERRELACFSYPGYVIKQLDAGEVGAEQLAIEPTISAGNGTTNSNKAGSCNWSKEDEADALPPEMWSGYFAGARGGYAFFTAADGANGGTGFIVVRMNDRKKLAEDAYDKGFTSIELRGGMPLLHYQRVYAAQCSVVTDGKTCSDTIAHDTGITAASLAICAKGYRVALEVLARERCKADGKSDAACLAQAADVIRKQKWDASPSVVVYSAELDMHETSSAEHPVGDPSIKALGNALACRPAD